MPAVIGNCNAKPFGHASYQGSLNWFELKTIVASAPACLPNRHAQFFGTLPVIWQHETA